MRYVEIGNEMDKQIDRSVEQEKTLFKARNARKAKGFSHSSTQQGAHQQNTGPIERSKNALAMR